MLACACLLSCSSNADEPVLDAASGAGMGGGVGGSSAADGAMPQIDGGSTLPSPDSGEHDGSAGGTDSSTPGTDGGADGGSGAGSDPHPRFADLADGAALDLGEFDCTAPEGEEDGQCRAVTDYSGLVYDGNSHQLLMFGGGHSTTMTDTIFAFDLDQTLSWTELYLPTPCELMIASNLDAELGAWKMGPSGPYPRPLSVHTYDLNAFSPEQDEFLMLSRMFTGGYCNSVGNDVGGNVAHYSMQGGTWSFSDSANATPSTAIPASELDPSTGLIVVFGSDGLKLYDPIARAYVEEIDSLQDPQGGAFDINALGYANHMTYFPPNDTFYFFMRGEPVEVIALKLDRAEPERSTVEMIATEGPTSGHSEPGYDYDAVNEIIGGGVFDNTFYVFDPIESAWSAHPIEGGAPGNQAFHALGYDPVSNVFIFRTEYASGSHTWAYRFRNAP